MHPLSFEKNNTFHRNKKMVVSYFIHLTVNRVYTDNSEGKSEEADIF